MITSLRSPYDSIAGNDSDSDCTFVQNERHIAKSRFHPVRELETRIGPVASIDNWLMIDRLSYPAEPLNAERYRKPNEDHVDNQPQN